MNHLLESLRDYLFWLDAVPSRFWLTACFSLGLSCLLAFTPSLHGPVRFYPRGIWFSISVTLTLLAFRWPSWFYPHDFNPDEAQIIAGAITLNQFPVIWKHLDPTTHGPLLELALIFAHA